jgi:hypothetical protein
MFFVYGEILYTDNTKDTIFCDYPENNNMYVRNLFEAHQFASKEEAKTFLNKKSMANFIKWIGILEKV